jgi:hypothetical protein
MFKFNWIHNELKKIGAKKLENVLVTMMLKKIKIITHI